VRVQVGRGDPGAEEGEEAGAVEARLHLLVEPPCLLLVLVDVRESDRVVQDDHVGPGAVDAAPDAESLHRRVLLAVALALHVDRRLRPRRIRVLPAALRGVPGVQFAVDGGGEAELHRPEDLLGETLVLRHDDDLDVGVLVDQPRAVVDAENVVVLP
jgi:hypothetical protein